MGAECNGSPSQSTTKKITMRLGHSPSRLIMMMIPASLSTKLADKRPHNEAIDAFDDDAVDVPCQMPFIRRTNTKVRIPAQQPLKAKPKPRESQSPQPVANRRPTSTLPTPGVASMAYRGVETNCNDVQTKCN